MTVPLLELLVAAKNKLGLGLIMVTKKVIGKYSSSKLKDENYVALFGTLNELDYKHNSLKMSEQDSLQDCHNAI